MIVVAEEMIWCYTELHAPYLYVLCHNSYSWVIGSQPGILGNKMALTFGDRTWTGMGTAAPCQGIRH